MRRATGAAVIALVVLMGLPDASSAREGEAFTQGVEVREPGRAGSNGLRKGDDTSSVPPFFRRRTGWSCLRRTGTNEVIPVGWATAVRLAGAAGELLHGDAPPAWEITDQNHYVVVRNPAFTGDIDAAAAARTTFEGCSSTVPVVPPRPPTASEVIARVRLTPPGIEMKPHSEPITGMESHFWAVTDGVLTDTVAIRGYTATITARPVRFVWSWGGGRTVTPSAGSEHRPVKHVFETRGDTTVRVTVVWAGEFVVTGWGTRLGPLDLGEKSVTSSKPVHVIEVRSVVDIPPSERGR